MLPSQCERRQSLLTFIDEKQKSYENTSNKVENRVKTNPITLNVILQHSTYISFDAV